MGTDKVVTRRFLADPVTFVVRCPTSAVRDAIEAAFTDLAQGSDLDAVDVELRQGHKGTLAVAVNGETRFTGQHPNQALGAIVTSVTRIALDGDPGRLHLHCAAVSQDGQGVLITAPSGTGKTTLAAKLLMRGWSYGSDESAAVSSDGSIASTFAKPLMIKDGNGGPIRDLAPLRVVLDDDDDRIWTVPASSMGVDCVDAVVPRSIVILTDEPPGPGPSPAQPVSIHPADAVVAMMQQTMDAGRYGRRAVDVLASLAARCRCVRMQVGPLDTAADALERLVAGPPAEVQTSVLQPEPQPELPWHVAEAVRSVRIGDRVAIHDTNGGAVSALDEAGTAVWLTLLGDPPEGWSLGALKSSAIEGFIQALITMGFLHVGQRHSEHA